MTKLENFVHGIAEMCTNQNQFLLINSIFYYSHEITHFHSNQSLIYGKNFIGLPNLKTEEKKIYIFLIKIIKI